VKTNFRRWLPAISSNRTNSVVLGLAALAVAGGVAAGTATAAVASAETAPAAAVSVAADKPAVKAAAKAPAAKTKAPAKAPAKAAKKLPASKSVKHKHQLQTTYYFCGPSATRVALSAKGKVYSENKIARMLGTTQAGTNSAYDITRVLNKELGKNRYKTVMIPGQKATTKQIAKLKADVMDSLSKGDVVVANVVGTVKDYNGDFHSYEGGHYIPVVGYSDNGKTVRIADTADTVGSPYYEISTRTLAHWIGTRGYSA
jgi:hypothetical protein